RERRRRRAVVVPLARGPHDLEVVLRRGGERHAGTPSRRARRARRASTPCRGLNRYTAANTTPIVTTTTPPGDAAREKLTKIPTTALTPATTGAITSMREKRSVSR